MSIFLTKSELAELTGKKHKSTQMKQLSEQGISFVVGGDGFPRVLKEAVLIRLGVKQELSDCDEQELYLGQ